MMRQYELVERVQRLGPVQPQQGNRSLPLHQHCVVHVHPPLLLDRKAGSFRR